MIAPRSPSSRPGRLNMPAADLAMQRNVPTRLIWMILSNASSGKCLISPLSLERDAVLRSEEHTSELQSLMRITYAVFCLSKTNNIKHKHPVQSYAINNTDIKTHTI